MHDDDNVTRASDIHTKRLQVKEKNANEDITTADIHKHTNRLTFDSRGLLWSRVAACSYGQG